MLEGLSADAALDKKNEIAILQNTIADKMNINPVICQLEKSYFIKLYSDSLFIKRKSFVLSFVTFFNVMQSINNFCLYEISQNRLNTIIERWIRDTFGPTALD